MFEDDVDRPSMPTRLHDVFDTTSVERLGDATLFDQNNVATTDQHSAPGKQHASSVAIDDSIRAEYERLNSTDEFAFDETIRPSYPTLDPRPPSARATEPPQVADDVPTPIARGAVGQPFGDYRLLGVVGEGGMAQAHIAIKTSVLGLHRPMVVKRILRAHVHNADYVQMFEAESQVSLQLRHPNIVKFCDAGTVDGTPFLAMELIDGVDASGLFRLGGNLSTRAALELGCRVADALAYAHDLEDDRGVPLNVIHRDISPENLLVSRDGEVKLADFGIATFDGRAFQTAMGQARGRIRYIAPEQLTALLKPDARADLFSLGVVLAELITGMALLPDGPLEGERPQTVVRAALESMKHPPPESIVAFLSRLAHVDRNERPARAEDVALELRRLTAEVKRDEPLSAMIKRTIGTRLPPTEEVIASLIDAQPGLPSLEALEPQPVLSKNGANYPTTALLARIIEQGDRRPSMPVYAAQIVPPSQRPAAQVVEPHNEHATPTAPPMVRYEKASAATPAWVFLLGATALFGLAAGLWIFMG